MKINEIVKEFKDWQSIQDKIATMVGNVAQNWKTAQNNLQKFEPFANRKPKRNRDDMRKFQQMLITLGFDVGPTGADGKWGPNTAKATQNFQKTYGLSVDGDPGPRTMRKVDDLIMGRTKAKAPEIISNPREKLKRPTKAPQKLQQKALEQGVYGRVLDFIAQFEAVNGHYDSVFPSSRKPEILDMTINQVLADGGERVRDQIRGRRFRSKKTGNYWGSSAMGRYQYIRKTLKDVAQRMGLDFDKDKFDPETQDKIAIFHLKQDHQMEEWLKGQISDKQFLKRLSRTWASIPDPDTDMSHFAGDVLGNKAGIDSLSAKGYVASIRKDSPWYQGTIRL